MDVFFTEAQGEVFKKPKEGLTHGMFKEFLSVAMVGAMKVEFLLKIQNFFFGVPMGGASHQVDGVHETKSVGFTDNVDES